MSRSQPNNFTEAAAVLVQHNALLVHCAGHVQMVAGVDRIEDPVDRLQNAIRLMCNVACSTLVPGDVYLANSGTNITGPLGLILDPVSPGNITMCCHFDAGTFADKANPKARTGACIDRRTNERFPGLTLTDAIARRARTEYNEICCHSYRVLGLLVAEDPARFGGNDITEPVYDEDGILTGIRLLPSSGYSFTCAALRPLFPELPIYRWFPNQGIRRFEGSDAQGSPILSDPISVASIYALDARD